MATQLFSRKRAMILIVMVELIALTIYFLIAIKHEGQTKYEVSGDELFFASDNAPEDFEHDGAGNQINGQLDVGVNRRLVSPSLSVNKCVYQVDVVFSTNTPRSSTIGTHIAAYDASYAMYSTVKSEITKLFGEKTNTSFIVHVSERTPIVFRAIMDDESKDIITVESIIMTRLALRSVLPSLLLVIIFFSIFDCFAFVYFFRKEACFNYFKDRGIYIVTFMIVIALASIPLFAGNLLTGYDQRFHYYRVYALSSGLRSGSFPAMIYPEYANGYGYANGLFYPDVFLYLPALLYLIGVRMEIAYKIFILAINFFTAVISYFSFTKLSKNRKLGIIGMSIYTMSLPRLVALYTRGAIAAACAYCFAPLFILGLYLMFCDDELDKDAYLYMAIGISGIVSSHMLGSVIAVAFAFIYVLLHVKKLFKPAILIQLSKAVMVSLVLTSWFLVPFVPAYLNTDLVIKHAENDIARFAAYPAQLFSNSFNIIGDTREDLVGMYHDMPMSLGLVSLMLIILMATYVLIIKKNTSSKRTELCKLSIVFLISLWASTTLFPYKWLYYHANRIYTLIATVQFAYRFLAPAICILTVMVINGIQIANEENPQYKKWIYGVGGLVAALFVLQGTNVLLDYTNEMPIFEFNDSFRELDYSALYTKEYLPTDFDLGNTPATISSDALNEIGGYANIVFRDGNHIMVDAYNPSESEHEMAFPLLYYPGYGASVNGEKLEVYSGENCRVCVRIPENFSGMIDLKPTNYISWNIAYFISLIGVMGVFSYMIIKKNRIKKV